MDTLLAMRAFVHVVEKGSFTAAGHLLDLRVPRISRLISELEESLGAVLLVRGTRKHLPTPIGRRYFERAQQILAEVKAAEVETMGRQSQAQGSLRLYANAEFGVERLMPLVVEYMERYPEVSLDLSLGHATPDPLEGGYDMVLALTRELTDCGYVAQRLGQASYVVCAAPSYLERHGVPRTPRELSRHRCLDLAGPAAPGTWRFEDEDQVHTLEFEQVLRVDLPQAISAAAIRGVGVCLLPAFVAAGPLAEGKLVRLLPRYELHDRGLFAIYPSRYYLDAKVRTWIDFLKERLPEVLAQDRKIIDDPAYWAHRRLPEMRLCVGAD